MLSTPVISFTGLPLLTSPASERTYARTPQLFHRGTRTRSRSPTRLSEPLRMLHEMMLLNENTPLKLRFRIKEPVYVTCSRLLHFPSHPQHPNSNQLFCYRQNPTFKGLQRVPRRRMRKETATIFPVITIGSSADV